MASTLPGKFSRCPGSNEMREGDTTLRPSKTCYSLVQQ